MGKVISRKARSIVLGLSILLLVLSLGSCIAMEAEYEADTIDCTVYYRDDDNDGYGQTGDSMCLDAPADPYDTTLSGDCNDNPVTGTGFYPGAPDVWYDGLDTNCDGANDYDADYDGYVITGGMPGGTAPYTGDCDDNDASINPGATEVCDGQDNDCDTLIDEAGATNCTTYYRDDDDDGYGQTGDSLCLCAASDPYDSTVGGDCDDSDASINPGATEVCDGKDNDCDLLIDEAGATNCTTYYRDNDDDGYGQTGDSMCLCAASDPYDSTVGGDCDDNVFSINPGATEVCNGFDDDCDALTDEAGATGCTTYYRDDDDDSYGQTGDSLCLCAASDPYDSTVGGDCNDSLGTIYPGAAEIWYDGVDEDCDGANDYDADGDTYVATGYEAFAGGTAPNIGDCDDSHDSVNPGVTEIWYDGVDQNCNGDNDYDADGDTYVATGYEAFAGGTAPYTGDCDDSDASVHPGVTEIPFNGKDDDCNPATSDLLYDLIMATNPEEGGTATDLIDESPYAEGTEITIRAEAAEGYEFIDWTVFGGSLNNTTAAETTFTMPAHNVIITANFEEVGGGEVDCGMATAADVAPFALVSVGIVTVWATKRRRNGL